MLHTLLLTPVFRDLILRSHTRVIPEVGLVEYWIDGVCTFQLHRISNSQIALIILSSTHTHKRRR